MAVHILEESKRCLQCKRPLCREGCPVNTPIPQMISLLLSGKIEEAGTMLYRNNPMSVVCSLICPVGDYCEGHCVLNRKSNPIHVSAIENYISNFYLGMREEVFEAPYSGKIAVIGGGPAGISLSVFLATYGYELTIFESMPRVGGVMRYGIPEYRLPNSILDKLEVHLHELGIRIHPNMTIGPTFTLTDLFRDGYEAIFVGTGVWNPKRINLKGETLPNVYHAINFLKSPDVYNLGETCVVIGAGNVAMDVARTAKRKGVRNVIIFYRRGREDIRATEEEITYTELDGVEFKFHTEPLEFTLEGLYYKSSEEGAEEERGFFPCDSIVIAISQASQKNIANSDELLQLNEKGLIITDENGETTHPGVFATGDVVTGTRTVVDAVAGAKKIANQIHKYIQLKDNPDKEIEDLFL